MIVFCGLFDSDRTIKLWNLESVVGAENSREEPVKLSSQAVVAAHDKDINAVAIAPNDSLVCSGSQVTSELHHPYHHFLLVKSLLSRTSENEIRYLVNAPPSLLKLQIYPELQVK